MSKMLIGYHNHIDDAFKEKVFFDGPAKECGGIDFMVMHVDPHGSTLEEECEKAKKVGVLAKEYDAEIIVNFEGQNFVHKTEGKDGYDWANYPDGTHRVKLPKEYIEAFNSVGNCGGVMYDELEHCIINRNLSIALSSKFKTDLPVFPVPDTKDALKQGDILSQQLKDYADEIKSKGAATLSGEHVFPVLFHKFAKVGIIPNFKSQKESYSNVQFAVAAGAAIQYDMPLWNCVDLWCRMTYPGHSPKEMKANLEFAYLMGVDRVYVESVSRFYEEKDGGMQETEYGKIFCDFVKKYRNAERPYSIRDYRPEIAIIRYDDSFWGQGRLRWMWRNMLMGNPKIKCDRLSKEWVKAFNIITHGATGNGGLTWSRIELRSLTKHRSFAPMNSPVVFDDEVKKESLSSVKLCFLCGRKISGESLCAIAESVRENGLVAVSPLRFLPDEIKKKAVKNGCEIPDGKGKWIVTDYKHTGRLAKKLSGYLGEKDEMSFRFADRLLKMKISADGETFTIKD